MPIMPLIRLIDAFSQVDLLDPSTEDDEELVEHRLCGQCRCVAGGLRKDRSGRDSRKPPQVASSRT